MTMIDAQNCLALAAIDAEIAACTHDLAGLQRQIAAVKRRLRTLRHSAATLAPDRTAHRVERATAVALLLNVMSEANGRGVSLAYLVDQMTARGRPTSKQVVANTLTRLKNEGYVTRHRKNWFVVPTNQNGGPAND